MLVITIFNNVSDVYDCYGQENIIPITNIKQVIFYAKNHVQPKYIDESEKNEGHIVFYYHKGETRLAYEKWMNVRPDKIKNK